MNGSRATVRARAQWWLLQGLVVVVPAALLLGLGAIGNVIRDDLRRRDRFTVPFAEIRCLPPPGQDASDFLDEVRYLADMPEQISLLDEAVTRRLALAFARHPRVEKVERVLITPPRNVRVYLVYRTPAPRP